MNSFEIIDFIFLGYSFFIMGSYLLLGLISRMAFHYHRQKNTITDFVFIAKSALAPKVSLIAPAYNESQTIIGNVKSLLALRYNQLEIIIVNDGSSDDTMEKLIDVFQLRPVSIKPTAGLRTKKVRKVYRSGNRLFQKLIVIDKENGGKSDALNVGINQSRADLIACIDVDCIIDQNGILRLVKPFLQDQTVIAAGGVIRVLNDSKVKDGTLQQVELSNKLLSRFQVLEYTRAFLLGRMAWSKLNGLIIISGAFGMFRKDIVVAVGGYDNATVGEDMELVVRMRRYMHDQSQPYHVEYIPEPLCWTEVPQSIKVLSKQRNRWTRGTIETIRKHRSILMNPKYGTMGLLSLPYWLLFEWLAPILEVLGVLTMILATIYGFFSIEHALFMLSFLYAFAITLSSLAMLAEEKVYFDYQRLRDFFKMVPVILLEPIIYHPLNVYWSIRGNIDYVMGKNNWGEMKRKGF